MNQFESMNPPPSNTADTLPDTGRNGDRAEWGRWVPIDIAEGTIPGDGWASSFRQGHINRRFIVWDRTLEHGVRHLVIKKRGGGRPTWWEAQRIKNEIVGEDRTAVEIYPPQGDVIDEADLYHLWALPEGKHFTFGLRAAGGDGN